MRSKLGNMKPTITTSVFELGSSFFKIGALAKDIMILYMKHHHCMWLTKKNI